MQPYLKLDHIDKVYTRGSASTEVLKDVYLTIGKGEYVSIIGHSRCGKSTLLNIVAGLTDATMGCVLLENREVNSPGPDRAVVFQNHSLLPWLTVYENVKLGVDKVFSKTKSRAERDAWVMHNLNLVQMAHAKDKRPSEISGGMKQRVGIARALAMEPKGLLLLEAFGAGAVRGARGHGGAVAAWVGRGRGTRGSSAWRGRSAPSRRWRAQTPRRARGPSAPSP